MSGNKNFHRPFMSDSEEATNLLIEAVTAALDRVKKSEDFIVTTIKDNKAEVIFFGDPEKVLAGLALYLHKHPNALSVFTRHLRSLQLQENQN